MYICEMKNGYFLKSLLCFQSGVKGNIVFGVAPVVGMSDN